VTGRHIFRSEIAFDFRVRLRELLVPAFVDQHDGNPVVSNALEHALLENPRVNGALGTEELQSLLDPTTYVGLAPAIFGPLMNVTGSILASWWHRKPPKGGSPGSREGSEPMESQALVQQGRGSEAIG